MTDGLVRHDGPMVIVWKPICEYSVMTDWLIRHDGVASRQTGWSVMTDENKNDYLTKCDTSVVTDHVASRRTVVQILV